MSRVSITLPVLLAALLAASCGAGLVAQELTFQRLDGTRVQARLARITTDPAAEREVIVVTGGQGGAGGGEQRIPFSQLLAIHGPAPAAERETPQAIVLLAGNDRLEGEIRGGDEAGENVQVSTRALGELTVPIDRLSTILFPRVAPGIGPGDLRIPDGAGDEALFQKAARGLDIVLGGIHRFTARGVAFEWSEAKDRSKPQHFGFDKLAGIALRGGVAQKRAPTCQLVTRAGDVIGVDLLGATDGKLELGWGEGRLRVAFADLACLTLLDGGKREFLSDLEPARVEERGAFPVLGEPGPPLYRWQRDRTATGAFLEGGGLCHGKGLGVHSKSVLTYRVPEHRAHFFALVALSEEPFAGEVRGQVDVVVRQDDRVLFELKGLRGGQPPQNVGPLAVTPGALLTLEVDFGKGLGVADRVNWLSAVLLP